MKTLIVLRHGKAEQAGFYEDDFARNLTERGRQNASGMGKFISGKIDNLDLIIASDAERTIQTAVLASQNMNYPKEEIQFNSDLYLASARRILKIINHISDDVKSCMIVGHNPGLTDLVNFFGVKLDNLPTASAVCFDFDADKWINISEKNGKFKWIQLSRDL